MFPLGTAAGAFLTFLCHFFALLSGDRDLLLSTLFGQAAAAVVIEPLDIRKGNEKTTADFNALEFPGFNPAVNRLPGRA
jgi:hypothetical protein